MKTQTHSQPEPELLVAAESAVFRYEGADVVLVAGQTRVPADHPIVRGREHLFEPCGPSRGYETATAAPGEKRS